MSDTTAQAEPEAEPQAEAEADKKSDRPDYNQALPSIATWTAPWEDNPNRPFHVPSPLEQMEQQQQQ